MSIDPKDYQVSSDLIRKRLQLPNEAVVVPYGYEGILDQAIISVLKSRYDIGSLFIRTRPDFVVIEDNVVYFVEAKQKTENLEAIQLLYNKQYERMGLKVVYSFPELAIPASLIPMETVIVPENYQKKFDENLKHLFETEGITNFRYVNRITLGSGDAFVPVEVDDLKILVGDNIIA